MHLFPKLVKEGMYCCSNGGSILLLKCLMKVCEDVNIMVVASIVFHVASFIVSNTSFVTTKSYV